MIKCQTTSNLHLLLLAQSAASGIGPGFAEDVPEGAMYSQGLFVAWKHRLLSVGPIPVFRAQGASEVSSEDHICVFVGYYRITKVTYFVRSLRHPEWMIHPRDRRVALLRQFGEVRSHEAPRHWAAALDMRLAVFRLEWVGPDMEYALGHPLRNQPVWGVQ